MNPDLPYFKKGYRYQRPGLVKIAEASDSENEWFNDMENLGVKRPKPYISKV